MLEIRLICSRERAGSSDDPGEYGGETRNGGVLTDSRKGLTKTTRCATHGIVKDTLLKTAKPAASNEEMLPSPVLVIAFPRLPSAPMIHAHALRAKSGEAPPPPPNVFSSPLRRRTVAV